MTSGEGIEKRKAQILKLSANLKKTGQGGTTTGKCFFHAASQHLGKSHQESRNNAVQYLSMNKEVGGEKLKDFLSLDERDCRNYLRLKQTESGLTT